MNIDYSFIALCISAAGLSFIVFDRIWGSGNRAATAESAHREYTDLKLSELRREVFLKHDTTEGNIGQSLVAMKDTLHAMQIEAVNFRAFSAETYMRRDSYYKASEELKRDVHTAFDKIDKRLERMEDNMARKVGH